MLASGFSAGSAGADEQADGTDARLVSAYEGLDPASIEEAQADLVVIGAGPSGMAAARPRP